MIDEGGFSEDDACATTFFASTASSTAYQRRADVEQTAAQITAEAAAGRSRSW